MPKFEERYVYFRWSRELEGKEVLCADHIDVLEKQVVKSWFKGFGVVKKSVDTGYPFETASKSWQFCYYDPNYEAKIAYEQGKKIECKRKGDAWGDLDWDYTPSPAWLDDHEYRIMKENQPEENPDTEHQIPKSNEAVPNRKLSRWLSRIEGLLIESVDLKLSDLTLRDIFAGFAILGVAVHGYMTSDIAENTAEQAYIIADAMMKERMKSGEFVNG